MPNCDNIWYVHTLVRCWRTPVLVVSQLWLNNTRNLLLFNPLLCDLFVELSISHKWTMNRMINHVCLQVSDIAAKLNVTSITKSWKWENIVMYKPSVVVLLEIQLSSKYSTCLPVMQLSSKYGTCLPEIQLDSTYGTCLLTIQVIVLCFWYNYPVSMTRAYLPFKSLFCAFDSVNNTQSLDVTRSKTIRRIRKKMFLVTWMFNKIYHVFILLLKTCTWSTFI